MTFPTFEARRQYVLNSLSVIQDIPDFRVKVCLDGFIKCLSALRPFAQSRAIRIFSDGNFHSRLLGERPISAQFNKMCDADNRTLWSIFRTQMIEDLGAEGDLEIKIKGDDAEDGWGVSGWHVSGVVSWISLCTKRPYDENMLIIQSEDTEHKVVNVFSESGMRANIPTYEANIKHGNQEYINRDNVVSVMDLNRYDSILALLRSEGEEHVRYSFVNGSYYCFRRHEIRGGVNPVYHGYKCGRQDVPDNLLEIFEQI